MLFCGMAIGYRDEAYAAVRKDMPEDAELLYLSGLALLRAGQHEAALERLVRAVDKDPQLRHGHPYFVAGQALLALQRWDDAVDAFERFRPLLLLMRVWVFRHRCSLPLPTGGLRRACGVPRAAAANASMGDKSARCKGSGIGRNGTCSGDILRS